MTLKELKQLYWLKLEIEGYEKKLKELERDAQSISAARLTGMPKGTVVDSKVERDVIKAADYYALIKAKKKIFEYERDRLERYIADIPDSLTRQIFTLRFVNGLSWVQLAFSIGGNCTADSARMTCNRYIQKTNEQKN